MKELTLTINDRQIKTKPGKTILEVVRENDLDRIPTLCHDPRLEPYGSCYVCVVEVEGQNKLLPSCCSPVSQGMVIRTASPQVIEARRMALELLLSNHYADCIAPCRKTCPAGVDVQGYIALIAAGKPSEAIRLIKETNPLPIVCGRVCVRECEIACRRNIVDEAVGIDYLKRYAADIDIEDPWRPQPAPANGLKVAVVGGGPAGLTCAYFLALKGYQVTIFEQRPHLGGMLRYGIPEYRLPKQILDREINWITDLGIEVRLNQAVNQDFSISALKSSGYDAVFLAIGAQAAKKMRLVGEDTFSGILPGVDFLRDLQLRDDIRLHGRVAVVGGGNTAIDAARNALRLGAEKVLLLYRRTMEEMPAHHAEVEAALAEGVEIVFLVAPLAITEENGQVTGLKCQRMGLGPPDESGRRSPVPIPESEWVVDCNFIIPAIGQDVDPRALRQDDELKISRWGTIIADEKTFATSIPGVFAGGDALKGPAVAIDAIAHGRLAAVSIDHYLRENTLKSEPFDFVNLKETFHQVTAAEYPEVEKSPRQKMPELDPAERIKSFEEVELGFSSEQADNECSRCLSCGCQDYFDCELRALATEYEVKLDRLLGEVREYPVDRRHEFITLDANKCISCGRCVRTCDFILDGPALGFVHRGFRSVVKPALEKSLAETNCISCGNCIDTCPTGAIDEIPAFSKPGPWQGEKSENICTFCSMHCRLTVHSFSNGRCIISGGPTDSHNRGYLCIKARRAYRSLSVIQRENTPRQQQNGVRKKVTWEKALLDAAEQIKAIAKKHGPQSVALLAGPGLSDRELTALSDTARNKIGTGNLLFPGLNRMNDPESGQEPEKLISDLSLDQLEQTALIVVFNADLRNDSLIMELRLKETKRNGARLLVCADMENELARSADFHLPLAAEKTRDFFHQLAGLLGRPEEKALAEAAALSGLQADELRSILADLQDENKHLVFITNPDRMHEKAPGDLAAARSLLKSAGKLNRPGSGLILVGSSAASATAAIKGFQPHLPVPACQIKALLAFGFDPLADESFAIRRGHLDLLLVCAVDSNSQGSKSADFYLPAAAPFEASEVYTACDGRRQTSRAVFSPPAGLTNLEIIELLTLKLAETN